MENAINRTFVNKDSPFKTPNNRYLLRALFYEERPHDCQVPAVYTLDDKDKGQYLSMYRLYMEEADLTEYDFATKYLDSWEQWTRLISTAWFKPHIERWRTELELKLKAEALRRIIKEAVEGGKNSYNANKFIIDKGWIAKETEASRRGRPSKSDIARQAAEEVFNTKQINDAAKRLEIN